MAQCRVRASVASAVAHLPLPQLIGVLRTWHLGGSPRRVRLAGIIFLSRKQDSRCLASRRGVGHSDRLEGGRMGATGSEALLRGAKWGTQVSQKGCETKTRLEKSSTAVVIAQRRMQFGLRPRSQEWRVASGEARERPPASQDSEKKPRTQTALFGGPTTSDPSIVSVVDDWAPGQLA